LDTLVLCSSKLKGRFARRFELAATVVVSRGDRCSFSQIVAFFLAEIGFSQRPRRNRDYLVDGAVIVIAGSKWRWQPIIVVMVIYYFGYVSSLFLKIERSFLTEIFFSQRRLLFLAETVVVSRRLLHFFSRRLVSRRDHGGTEII